MALVSRLSVNKLCTATFGRNAMLGGLAQGSQRALGELFSAKDDAENPGVCLGTFQFNVSPAVIP